MFVVCCNAAATYYEVSERIGSEFVSAGSNNNTVVSPLWRVQKDAAETMRVVGGKFGLTPSDRAGLDTSENSPTHGAERILGWTPGADRSYADSADRNRLAKNLSRILPHPHIVRIVCHHDRPWSMMEHIREKGLVNGQASF
jgi:hypothetical protein